MYWMCYKYQINGSMQATMFSLSFFFVKGGYINGENNSMALYSAQYIIVMLSKVHQTDWFILLSLNTSKLILYIYLNISTCVYPFSIIDLFSFHCFSYKVQWPSVYIILTNPCVCWFCNDIDLYIITQ